MINGALQQENDQLKEEAESYGEEGGRASGAEQELAELQEEFTNRLGVAEKTVRTFAMRWLRLLSVGVELRNLATSCVVLDTQSRILATVAKIWRRRSCLAGSARQVSRLDT